MRRQSPMRRLMSYLTTLLTTDSFNKEIKLFTLGDHFIERYRDISTAYYEETRGLLIRRYLAGFGWGALTIVASSGTFLYVAILALRGTISLGALTVYTQAAQQVQGAFQGILGGFQGIYEHGLYLSTLYDLLDRNPQIAAPDDTAAGSGAVPGGDRVPQRFVSLPRQSGAGAGRRFVRHPTGRNGRPGRPQRRRQIDDRQAARAPLRPDGGGDPDRRPRRPRLRPGGTAAAVRDDVPGLREVPAQRRRKTSASATSAP